MKAKTIVILASLAVVVAAGIWAVAYAEYNVPNTYEGEDINVVDLYEDVDGYDLSNANGVAEVIVEENLDKTMAVNNVAAVVFDFRGFDTLGESFILLTAIAGSFVILAKHKKKKREEDKK